MKLNFYSSLILFSVLSATAHYFLFQKMDLLWNQWIWFLYIYFPISTLVIHRLLIKQLGGRPQAFVTVFMGTMAAKLFISLILLLFVVYLYPEIKIPFSISFLFLYLLYTTLNTIFVFAKLKQN